MSPTKMIPPTASVFHPVDWGAASPSGSPQGAELPLDPDFRTPFDFTDLLRSIQSPSLISNVFPLHIEGSRHEITKFLVLGKRAGGTPIRLSLFAGLEPGRIETVAAAVKLLTLLTISPVLAADYAVFGYPCVDPAGFAPRVPRGTQPAPQDERWRRTPNSADALFFRSELQRVAPNGILILRSPEQSGALRASVNSEIIARDVVRPALHRMRPLAAVEADPITVVSADTSSRRKRFEDGGLLPYPDTQPWPFEIEISAPSDLPTESRVQVLVLTVLDILKTYRGFSCHGGEL